MATSGVTVSDFDGSDDGRWHHRLTVTCDDRAGLLADLSEHLRAHEVDIVSAAVATDTESGHIVDSFAVRNPHRASSHGRATRLACARREHGFRRKGRVRAKPAALRKRHRCSRAAACEPRTLSPAAGCACGQAGAEPWARELAHG